MVRLALYATGGCLLLSLAAAGAWAVPATGSTGSLNAPAKVSIAIPAQALSTALIALGQQANVQVLTAGDEVADLRSAGVKGQLTVDEAMTSLLRGTDLDFAAYDAGTVVVKQREAPDVPSSGHGRQTIEPLAPTVTPLAPISVQNAANDNGYKIDATRGATRTDSRLVDVPQSVSVVTRDAMSTQQAISVGDVVRQVAGVQYVDGLVGPPLFRIRGFNAGNGMTDGMPNGVARTEDLPPLIAIDRIEVLKGPEAILGDASVSNNFGGSLNVVMKKPQRDPVHELTFSMSRYDGARVGIDLAGTVNGSDSVTYRLIAAGNYADHSPQGYQGQRGGYLAPSIAWQGASTRVMVGAERVDNRVPSPDHTVLLGNTLATASPESVRLGSPTDHAIFRTTRLFYSLDQAIAPNWTFRSQGQYVRQKNSGQGWSLVGNSDGPGAVGAVARSYRYSDAYYTLQNDIMGCFDQGFLKHTVVLGFDFSRTHAGSGSDTNAVVRTRVLPYDVFSSAMLPSARTQTTSSLAVDDVQPLGGSWSTSTGIFLQDQITIGERWDVLLAIRRTTYELETQSTPYAGQRTTREAQWIPKAGVVYKATPDISIYANTVSGFQADALLGENGQPLPPAKSRQVEAGVKFDLFDRNARLTAAVYRIHLDHSVDLVSPEPPYFATPGPGQTNRGLELEFAGQIAPGLALLASYTNAHIRNHDGTPTTGAPRQQFSTWVSYRFQHAPLQAWGIGAGVIARSHSLGRTSIDGEYFGIPGQASVETNVSYYGSNWRATLGVKNLFARTLYAVNFDAAFVPIREGRVVMLSGVYDF
ncbi:iron complex outermembrane receptor protein [Luteibacter rhizovicinus]|uniref:Iron complex outermembrane receptor protein n=1 Tax=Luteibacter rhizovicinus TaxID=242606 RepID=A0A4R3YR42_9GAMM|nr:TonB-dependent receptor [Luteibacter rhizovicinus]TCV94098.1 iron complex outermembrane receptor protein [Luteibacter rhizovicinus]